MSKKEKADFEKHLKRMGLVELTGKNKHREREEQALKMAQKSSRKTREEMAALLGYWPPRFVRV